MLGVINVINLAHAKYHCPHTFVVELQTKTASENGVLFHVRGGQILAHKTAAGRQGTSVTVRELFYNTPARLKYLKRPQTELGKITDMMNRLALANPSIAFILQHEQKTLLQTPGNDNQQQVLAAIYGLETAQKMVYVSGDSDHFAVSGFVSKPELTRGGRDYLTVLMNGRYVKSFSVSNAVIRGFGSKLMVGRFPIGVLNITTDPLLIDVNVHPQKAEIRVSQEDELTELLTRVVRERLADENLIPDAYQNLYGTRQTTEPVATPKTVTPAPVKFVPSGESVAPIVITDKAQLQSDDVQAFMARYAQPTVPVIDHFAEPVVTPQKKPVQETLEIEHNPTGFPDLDYIGQMHGTFLFAQSGDSLYLVDQHAAQERVNYEFYRDAIADVGDVTQTLLVPIVLDYSASDVLKIADFSEELAQLGLVLEQFGPTSLIVREHPAWFVAGQEADTVREMVDWLLRDGRISLAEFREKTAIMMSCKRAIKANHRLDDAQARALLTQLQQAQNPYNCPHGRPVLTQFSLTDMEKMFKRIQDSHESWQEYDEHPY